MYLITLCHVGGAGVDSLTYDRGAQTLVCTSSGGPVTNITWTKDGSALIRTSKFFYSQAILDTVSATYQHNVTILNKTSGDSGDYGCIVSNSDSSSSHSVDVQGLYVYMKLQFRSFLNAKIYKQFD